MAKYEKWVTSLVAHLGSHLNLLDWRVGLEFDVDSDIDGCVAFTSVDSRYLTAYIFFTPRAREFWNEGNIICLCECVIHEVCNILVDGLHKFALQAASPQTESQLTDILEQTTQRLTRIVAAQLPKTSLKV